MAKSAGTGVELESIDRLEDKLRRLVALVDSLKAEQAQTAEDNQRLRRELEAMRVTVASTEALNAELSSLRKERDVIRTRVGDMLEQLDALNL